jgi:PEP-CTERM motif
MHVSIRSAVFAAVLSAMSVAHAAVELQQQSAIVETTLYSGPRGTGAPTVGTSQYQIDTSRLDPNNLGSASLSASAQVNDQLSLQADARYGSAVAPDMLSLYSEFSFSSTRNVTTFSPDASARVVVRAQGRMIFSVDEDTLVSLTPSQSLASSVGFVPQSMNVQSSYRLVRIISDDIAAIDPTTGLPAVQSIDVNGVDFNGDTLLTSGNYMLSVDNYYFPEAWFYESQAFDLLTGKMVTVGINPNPGFYSSLKGSSSLTMRFAAAVPEPSTWALMALGLAGVTGVASARRRQRQIPPATH